MWNEVGVVKAEKFIAALIDGAIEADRRPNHGEEFYGAHERQHSEIFSDYLGSCTRYLSNKCVKEQKYHG